MSLNLNTAIRLAPAAVVTTDGNGSGVDISDLTGKCMIILNAGPTGGGGQTLDVKLQHSADNGVADAWTDAGVAFEQVTNAAASFQVITMDVDGFKKYVRVVDDIGGSDPTCARSVELIGKTAQG